MGWIESQLKIFHFSTNKIHNHPKSIINGFPNLSLVNPLSADTRGLLREIEVAATIESGSFTFVFLLISIVNFLISSLY